MCQASYKTRPFKGKDLVGCQRMGVWGDPFKIKLVFQCIGTEWILERGSVKIPLIL